MDPDTTPFFSPLPFPKRTLVALEGHRYEVMRDPATPPQVIEAANAYEAFLLSGVTHAAKITRYAPLHVPVLEASALTLPGASAPLSPREAVRQHLTRRADPLIAPDELNALMQGRLPEQSAAPGVKAGVYVRGDGFDELRPGG